MKAKRTFGLGAALGLCLLLLPLTTSAFYNPTEGRWLSRDPLGERGGMNLAVFVSNKPTTNIDPLGLFLAEQLHGRPGSGDLRWAENCRCKKDGTPVELRLRARGEPSWKDGVEVGNVGEVLAEMLKIKEGHCVKSLGITAHGNLANFDLLHYPENSPPDRTDDTLASDNITPANASQLFRSLASIGCFCKPCKIVIASCGVAMRPNSLGKQIANATGCEVHLPKGLCRPNVMFPESSYVHWNNVELTDKWEVTKPD